MKLQILQDNFSKAISTASRFTSAKAQLPVLGNILLKTERNKLIVGSTNLESSISIKIGAKISREGGITVPSNVINSLIGNLNSDSINLEVNKEVLNISSPNFKSSINGMNTRDFPVIPNSISKKTVSLNKESFIDSVQKVTYAASSDEVRPVLTGVLLIFANNKMKLVATDGFRLSLAEFDLKFSNKDISLILPRNTLVELTKLAGGEDKINMSFIKSENQVVFSVGKMIFSSRVIEGEFPDFEKIIPKSHKISINVDKEELLRGVRLASVFAKDASNMMVVEVGKDKLEISAESSQSGSQKTSVDALVKLEGTGKKVFRIAFNYRFVEEFLGSIGGEEVSIKLSDPNAPGVLTDPKDKNYTHLIMPVKLD